MKRKTVYIPVELAQQLEALAEATDVPETKIVSLALALLLQHDQGALKEALEILKESGKLESGK